MPERACTYPFFLGYQTFPCPAALYNGDERTRTIEIYVDGVLATSWTNSGNTAGLELVGLGVTGQEVMLRGVLDDSEWLSVNEVGIAHSLRVASEAGQS